MNSHVEIFKQVFSNHQKIYDKIIKILDIDKTNNYSELTKLFNDPDKLFMFAFTNGIVEIVIFLYQYMNISYNEKILNMYSVDDPVQSQQMVSANNVVMSNDNVRLP